MKDASCETDKDEAESRQETVTRVSKQTRAQKRKKRELRTKKRKEREENKKKKKKATEDRMKLLGELRTKNQPKILSWTVRQVGVSQRTTQGREKRNRLGNDAGKAERGPWRNGENRPE